MKTRPTLQAISSGAFAGLLIAALPLWKQQQRMPVTATSSLVLAGRAEQPRFLPSSWANVGDGAREIQKAESVKDFTAVECRKRMDAAVADGRKDLLRAHMCRWTELDAREAFAWLDEHLAHWMDVLPDAGSVWAAADPPACADWMEQNWINLDLPDKHDPTFLTSSPIWRCLLQKDLRLAIRVAGNLSADSPVGPPLSRKDLRHAIRSLADAQTIAAEVLAHPEWLGRIEPGKPLFLLVALRECWQEIDPDGWDRWAAAHPEAAEKSDNQPVHPGIKFLRSPDRAAAATEALQSAPAEKLEEISASIVRLWDDLEATGQWLNAQPDGPAKNAAAQAYALESAKEDPNAAMHWANAISDASSRARTQRRVFTAWHDADPAAASAWLPQSGWSNSQIQAAGAIMAAAPWPKQ